MTGAASRGIARRLRHHCYDVIDTAGFLVADTAGPLEKANWNGPNLGRKARRPDSAHRWNTSFDTGFAGRRHRQVSSRSEQFRAG